MTIDGYLCRAQAALFALGYFTCYCSEDADMPPEDCGFGLSVILSHIEDDVRAAYNEITKPKKEEA